MNLDLNLLRGILTLILLVAFIGLWIWAWSRKRIPAFEEAANLPFADENISRDSGVAASSQPISRHATGEHSV